MTVYAHSGEPIEPHDLWTAWTLDPGVAIPLLVAAWLYVRGSRGAPARQQWCFWLGCAALAIGLVSPLHALGSVLFSAHMAQHEILMLVAAPLLVLARPMAPLLRGLPMGWRRAAARWAKWPEVLATPFSAWWIHAVVLWVWHVPAFFQATLRNEWIHAAQHSSFLISAWLFWWALLYAHGRMAYGASVVYIFTTAVHTGILGALLTFTPRVWYPAYRLTAPAWGLSPLEDQQIGGLIMWVPAGAIYMAAGLALFAAWLRLSVSGKMAAFLEGGES